MLRTIVGLVSLPLWFATVKTKPSRTKRVVKKVRPARPKRTAKAARKRGAAPAASRKPPPPTAEAHAKPEEVAAPPPPPPPPAPIQAPGLFAPQQGEAAESLTPNFRWFYVGGASHYELVWSPDMNFHRQHILLTNQTAAALPPEQALEPGTTYAWRVRGGNESGWGPWSATRSFRTTEA